MSASSHKYLNLVFGAEYAANRNESEELRTALLGSLQRLGSYMQQLKGADSWRLSLVQKLSNHAVGRTVSNNTQKKQIWLSRDHVESAHVFSLARTLVHESAHAMYNYGSPQRVDDIWYLRIGKLSEQASEQDIENFALTALLTSAERIEAGPDEAKMPGNGRADYKRIIDGFQAASGGGAVTSAAQRLTLFKSDLAARRNVILHNADSYPGLLMAFRNKGK